MSDVFRHSTPTSPNHLAVAPNATTPMQPANDGDADATTTAATAAAASIDATAAAISSAAQAAEAGEDPSAALAFASPLLIFTHIAGVRHWLKQATAKATLTNSRATAAAAAAGLAPPPLISARLDAGQLLLAQREPTNPRDPHAIQLFLPDAHPDFASSSSSNLSAAALPPGNSAATLLSSSPSAGVAVGHVPAKLARFLSPLIARGLVTTIVHVVSAGADAEAVDVAVTSDEASPATSSDAAAPSRDRSRPTDQVHVRLEINPIPMDDFARAQLDPSSVRLWHSLREEIDSLSSASLLSSDERVVRHFALVLVAVLERFPHLWLPRESGALCALLAAPFDARRLFVRLFSRTRPGRWFQLSALKYEASGLNKGIEQLAALPTLNEEDESKQAASDDADEEMKDGGGVAAFPSAAAPSLASSSVVTSSSSPCVLVRASMLSLDAWSVALPLLLAELPLVSIKELIAALGLSKLLVGGGGGGSNAKHALLQHLTTQRTLFAAPSSPTSGPASRSFSLLRCNKTRATVLSVCGDFVQLDPDFLLLVQRVHRLFFLQEDPAEPPPMILEHLGISRYQKPATAFLTAPVTGAAQPNDADEEGNAHGFDTADAVAANAQLAGADNGVLSDVVRPSYNSSWSLFPSRACFLAYDVALQYFTHMHDVCETVLASGSEARRLQQSDQQTYSAAQALALLDEARRRMESEIDAPNSTAALPAEVNFALTTQNGTTSTGAGGKARTAAAFASMFSRAHSTPISASASAAAAAATTTTTSSSSSASSLSNPMAPFASVTSPIGLFVPCDPRSAAAQRFFDSSLSDPAHAFARRFRAASVYASACHYGARVLEREKRFEDANALYMRLLSTPLLPHRRGAWWNRLALNLETHARARKEAFEVVKMALKDSSVRTGDLHELRGRAMRLWKHKEGGNGRRPCPLSAGEESLPDFGRVLAVKSLSRTDSTASAAAAAASSSSSSSSLLHRAASDESFYSSCATREGVRLTTFAARPLGFIDGSTHSRFFSLTDPSNASVRVEDLALDAYAQPSFGAYVGRKDEGEVFRALFALLMFDVLFDESVPDVFHTPYHDAPLDLFTDAFYPARRDKIERNLAVLRSPTTSLSALLSEAWHTHFGVRVVGINWRTTELDLATLQEAAECMGGEAVAFVCDTMARDYRAWSGGLPDLCLWRPGQRPHTRTQGRRESSAAPAAAAADFTATLPIHDPDASIMDTLSPPPLAPPPTSTSIPPLVSVVPATSAACAASRPSQPASAQPIDHDNVICLSSGSDSEADVGRSLPPLRRRVSLPDARTPLKKPSLHAASSVPTQSASRKRVASGSSTPTRAASGAAKRSKGDSLKLSQSNKGNTPPISAQMSLHAFTSISPRFGVPPSGSVRPRARSVNGHAVDADDDEVMLLDNRSSPSASFALRSPSAIPSAAAAAAASSSSNPSWPSFKLVEVKGPGDRCSAQQIAWFAQLARCPTCTVEVCYVMPPSQMQPSQQRKGRPQLNDDEEE
jgi:hypothetical protein